tara:strand:- start:4554 stop:5144 length:591 start_codon:yes stop_codon:yes gene_type:complete
MMLTPAYLPTISYFKSIINQNELLLCVNTNYQKQTYRNRSVIFGANGRQNLIIPITKNIISQNDEHIEIHNEIPWQKNHWKSIETAYRSSPFFEYYKDEFRPFFIEEYRFLFQYNIELMRKILIILDLPIKLKKVNHNNDFKKNNYLIDPKTKLKRFKPYVQVFDEKIGFQSDLSIIDLIFNIGPEATEYIKSIPK